MATKKRLTGVKPANLVHCRYFAISPGKEPKIEFPEAALNAAVEKKSKSLRNRFVYVVDGQVVRMSKQIAEECASYIRTKLFAGAYDEQVSPLSEDWLKKKKRKYNQTHVGLATLEMVSTITAFRTNIRSKGEKKHKGYAVGILSSLEGRKRSADGKVFVDRKAVKPSAKLSMLEFGRKAYDHKNFFGKGIKVHIKKQPPRPVVKLAVMDYLNSIGIKAGFGGRSLKLPSNSSWVQTLKAEVAKAIKQ